MRLNSGGSVHNSVLWEHCSLWGFDWLRGRYFLPQLARWGKRVRGIMVDVGCGSKPYAAFFFHSALRYVGIDLPASGADADVFADAMHLPLAEASIDVCFNVWLLDDLSDPDQYFREINRILKPEGISIMIENQSFPEHDAPRDFFRFTRHGLERLAHRNGLIVEEMRPLGGFWAQIGLQLTGFFLRGVAGRWGAWVRVFNPPLNMLFYLLDRINPVSRGTSGYFVVFRKECINEKDAAGHTGPSRGKWAHKEDCNYNPQYPAL